MNIRFHLAVAAGTAFLAFGVLATGQDTPDSVEEIDVSGSQQWLETKVELSPGDRVKLTATGKLKYSVQNTEFGPEGTKRAWTDMLRNYPVNDAQKGALIGRIGDRDTARPFLIGSTREQRAVLAGKLYLGINQLSGERADGAFKVRIERYKAAETTKKSWSGEKLSQAQLDSIPRRVGDAAGTPGDRTNFVIVGSEKQVRDAFAAAGWVTVDRTTKDAIFRGILTSVSKQAYVTLPMSELLLFDRPQDYGYAQGDPLKVIAARHHFRIWRSPFTVNGRTVWVGAGTHDVGFDKDQRNGKLTHKIDPQVDGERDFITTSLGESGLVVLQEYMTPKDPITKAKTAHGQEFFSDGRTSIIYFEPDASEVATDFADYFCSVLKTNPDTGDWGKCGDYFEKTGKTDLALPAIPDTYRILIVPGFLSSCFAASPAYDEGQKALKEKYKLSVDLLPVPNDPSESNAKLIAAYLREKGPQDQRKFIIVGYSKGSPDVMEALQRHKDVVPYVAAFISAAGAAGGSVVADAVPDLADKWIRQYFKMQDCKGDIATGMKSLSRRERQAFLGAYPTMPVPSYSIIAVSGKENTSKALVQTWQILAAYDKFQDGQLTKQDAIVPGSTYLGAAYGDHFAVALPFDKSPDATIRSNMDKTRYPRAALLEAMVRFVVQDLGKKGGSSTNAVVNQTVAKPETKTEPATTPGILDGIFKKKQ